MEYKKLVSIVGKPGLWEIVNQRPDGLIAKPTGEGKTQFISSRLNQFTLLENISIYTEDDVETLENIFETMIAKLKDLPIPEKKASNDDYKKYFKEILPTYDEEKVYVSDIKKVVKWYNILQEFDLPKLLKNKKEEEEKAKKEAEAAKEDKKTSTAKDKKEEKEEKTDKKETKKKVAKKPAAKKVSETKEIKETKASTKKTAEKATEKTTKKSEVKKKVAKKTTKKKEA